MHNQSKSRLFSCPHSTNNPEKSKEIISSISNILSSRSVKAIFGIVQTNKKDELKVLNFKTELHLYVQVYDIDHPHLRSEVIDISLPDGLSINRTNLVKKIGECICNERGYNFPHDYEYKFSVSQKAPNSENTDYSAKYDDNGNLKITANEPDKSEKTKLTETFEPVELRFLGSKNNSIQLYSNNRGVIDTMLLANRTNGRIGFNLQTINFSPEDQERERLDREAERERAERIIRELLGEVTGEPRQETPPLLPRRSNANQQRRNNPLSGEQIMRGLHEIYIKTQELKRQMGKLTKQIETDAEKPNSTELADTQQARLTKLEAVQKDLAQLEQLKKYIEESYGTLLKNNDMPPPLLNNNQRLPTLSITYPHNGNQTSRLDACNDNTTLPRIDSQNLSREGGVSTRSSSHSRDDGGINSRN